MPSNYNCRKMYKKGGGLGLSSLLMPSGLNPTLATASLAGLSSVVRRKPSTKKKSVKKKVVKKKSVKKVVRRKPSTKKKSVKKKSVKKVVRRKPSTKKKSVKKKSVKKVVRRKNSRKGKSIVIDYKTGKIIKNPKKKSVKKVVRRKPSTKKKSVKKKSVKKKSVKKVVRRNPSTKKKSVKKVVKRVKRGKKVRGGSNKDTSSMNQTLNDAQLNALSAQLNAQVLDSNNGDLPNGQPTLFRQRGYRIPQEQQGQQQQEQQEQQQKGGDVLSLLAPEGINAAISALGLSGLAGLSKMPFSKNKKKYSTKKKSVKKVVKRVKRGKKVRGGGNGESDNEYLSNFNTPFSSDNFSSNEENNWIPDGDNEETPTDSELKMFVIKKIVEKWKKSIKNIVETNKIKKYNQEEDNKEFYKVFNNDDTKKILNELLEKLNKNENNSNINIDKTYEILKNKIINNLYYFDLISYLDLGKWENYNINNNLDKKMDKFHDEWFASDSLKKLTKEYMNLIQETSPVKNKTVVNDSTDLKLKIFILKRILKRWKESIKKIVENKKIKNYNQDNKKFYKKFNNNDTKKILNELLEKLNINENNNNNNNNNNNIKINGIYENVKKNFINKLDYYDLFTYFNLYPSIVTTPFSHDKWFKSIELLNLYKDDIKKKTNNRERKNRLHEQQKEDMKTRRNDEIKRIQSEPERTIERETEYGILRYKAMLENINNK